VNIHIAPVPAPWITFNSASELVTKRLAYALRAFLETCEDQYCPRWPLRTPGVSRTMAIAAAEYRRDRARGQRR